MWKEGVMAWYLVGAVTEEDGWFLSQLPSLEADRQKLLSDQDVHPCQEDLRKIIKICPLFFAGELIFFPEVMEMRQPIPQNVHSLVQL